jgi:hypothetical protein
MMDRAVRRLAGLCLLTVGLAGACAAHPKPPAPVAKPPPPPPKSCDTIEDACVATADTRSPIQQSGWWLAPPPSWTYAHDSDAMVARTDSARIAVMVRKTEKKKDSAKRAEALELVTRKLGLTPSKKTLTWPTKPAKTVTVGAVKVALYQFDGFTLEQKPGALLVFTSKLSDAISLLGVGFVLESDTQDADKAILACVESLRVEAAAEDRDAGTPR